MDVTDLQTGIKDAFTTERVRKSKLKTLFDLIVAKLTAFVTTVQTSEAAAAASAAQAAALNSTFIERSLSTRAAIYVDGLNGNDARTGTTNDDNVTTGRVKTLARVAALHSYKTHTLHIYLRNTVTIDAHTTIRCPEILFTANGTGKLFFAKLPTDNGSYTLLLEAFHVAIENTGPNITIETEGHSGNVLAEAVNTYNSRQGGLRFLKSPDNNWTTSKRQFFNCSGAILVAGPNSVIFAGTQNGAGTNASLGGTESFYRNIASITLGANAAVESGFHYNFLRTYTPPNSSDAYLTEGEFCSDANYLYRKQGGMIKKIAWTTF